MATLFNPLYFSIDGNGVPRAGATLTFSQTGTSMLQSTFTDSTLVTPNANPVVADSNGLFPPIYLSASFDYKAILKDSTGVTIATRDPIGYTPATTGTPLRSYLAGLTLSTAGGSSTFSVAAGSAADSTNVSLMTLAASISKTTSAWALGNGGGSLDTGAIAASTWYHAFEIQRIDTSVVDILTSLSATSPTMPANYTLFRRIGSMLTDGSKHWTAFVQDGDLFQWSTGVQDFTGTTAGSSAVTKTLASIPTGVNVIANLQVGVYNSSASNVEAIYLSDLATADVAPNINAWGDADDLLAAAGGVQRYMFRISVRTNTSAQIRTRQVVGDSSVTVIVNSLGWTDTRGRNA